MLVSTMVLQVKNSDATDRAIFEEQLLGFLEMYCEANRRVAVELKDVEVLYGPV